MNKRPNRNLPIKLFLIAGLTAGCGILNLLLPQEVPRKPSPSLPFKTCWTKSSEMTGKFNLASDNVSKLLLFSVKEKIAAIKSDSGEKLWEAELGGEIVSSPLLDAENKNIYVATIFTKNDKHGKSGNKTSDSLFEVKIRSLSKTTGITNWVTNLTAESPDTPQISVFIYRDKIIVGDRSGKLTALESSGGTVLWNKTLDSAFSGTYISQQSETLVIASDNKVFLVSPETGTVIYRGDINSRIASASIYGKNILITGDEKGEIRAINIDTGQKYWESRYGGQISNIVITDKGILITSFDNFVYLIVPETGKEIWKRRLGGRLIIKPFIIDHFAVVIILGNSKSAVIDMNSGKIVNQINLQDGDFFVNQPVVNNNMIIFPTNNGLIAFTNSGNKCDG